MTLPTKNKNTLDADHPYGIKVTPTGPPSSEVQAVLDAAVKPVIAMIDAMTQAA